MRYYKVDKAFLHIIMMDKSRWSRILERVVIESVFLADFNATNFPQTNQCNENAWNIDLDLESALEARSEESPERSNHRAEDAERQ